MTSESAPITVHVGDGAVGGFPAHDIHIIDAETNIPALRYLVRKNAAGGFPQPGKKPVIFFKHKEGPATGDLVGESYPAQASSHLNGTLLTIGEGPHAGSYYLVKSRGDHALAMNVTPQMVEKEAAWDNPLLVEAARAIGFIPPAPASPGYQLGQIPPTPPETPRSAFEDAARAFLTATAGGAGAALGWTAAKGVAGWLGEKVEEFKGASEEPGIEVQEEVHDTIDQPYFSARRTHQVVSERMGRLSQDG